MNKRELLNFMKENDFHLHRENGSHYIFRDKYTQLTVGKTNSDWRADRNNEARVTRAVAKRNEIDGVNPKEDKMNEEKRRVIIPGTGKAPVLSATFAEMAAMKTEKLPIVEADSKPKPNYAAKYPDGEKERMGLRIIDLRAAGLSYRKIVTKMNAEGFRKASGEPLTHASLYFIAYELGIKKDAAPATPLRKRCSFPRNRPRLSRSTSCRSLLYPPHRTWFQNSSSGF